MLLKGYSIPSIGKALSMETLKHFKVAHMAHEAVGLHVEPHGALRCRQLNLIGLNKKINICIVRKNMNRSAEQLIDCTSVLHEDYIPQSSSFGLLALLCCLNCGLGTKASSLVRPSLRESEESLADAAAVDVVAAATALVAGDIALAGMGLAEDYIAAPRKTHLRQVEESPGGTRHRRPRSRR